MKPDWQPIETAPIGETVLIFIPLYSGYDMVTAILYSSDRIGMHWRLVQCGDYAVSDWVEGHPTFWMPLPEPPET